MGVSLSGANPADFIQTNNCQQTTLPPNGSCTVNVTFKPQAEGARIASLMIGENVSSGFQSIILEGTGLSPLPILSASSLNFGTQPVGTDSPPLAVTLVNKGNAALNIGGIAVSGDFNEFNRCSTSLAPAGSCVIFIHFVPTAIGNRAGTLTITDNAAGTPQTVALSGMGAADFSIATMPGSPTSQTITAGQTATFQLVLTPSGPFSGAVSLTCSISPAVSSAPTCGLSSSSVQLSGGSGQTVTITVGTASGASAAPFSVPRWKSPSGFLLVAWMGLLLGSAWMLWQTRKRLTAFALPIMAFAFLLWIGCGGGNAAKLTKTPAGTYTATVTATAGASTQTTNLTIIVQ
jgi:hypothetical protein